MHNDWFVARRTNLRAVDHDPASSQAVEDVPPSTVALRRGPALYDSASLVAPNGNRYG